MITLSQFYKVHVPVLSDEVLHLVDPNAGVVSDLLQLSCILNTRFWMLTVVNLAWHWEHCQRSGLVEDDRMYPTLATFFFMQRVHLMALA